MKKAWSAAAAPGLVAACGLPCLTTDEHFDSPVAPVLRIAHRAGDHAGNRHAGILQGVDYAVHITRRRAVDADRGGGIAVEVVGDLARLAAVRTGDVVAAPGERELAERSPRAGRGRA